MAMEAARALIQVKIEQQKLYLEMKGIEANLAAVEAVTLKPADCKTFDEEIFGLNVRLLAGQTPRAEKLIQDTHRLIVGIHQESCPDFSVHADIGLTT